MRLGQVGKCAVPCGASSLSDYATIRIAGHSMDNDALACTFFFAALIWTSGNDDSIFRMFCVVVMIIRLLIKLIK